MHLQHQIVNIQGDLEEDRIRMYSRDYDSEKVFNKANGEVYSYQNFYWIDYHYNSYYYNSYYYNSYYYNSYYYYNSCCY